MKIFVIFLSLFLLVHGGPLKTAPTPSPGTADKLEGFPWIKASKAKARFGPTTHAPPTTEASDTPSAADGAPQEVRPVMTQDMLNSYIASLTAQLQPYVIKENEPTSPAPEVQQPPSLPLLPAPLPPKKSWKLKVPKAVDPNDSPPTTVGYWDQEKKLYPDSLYDEFYLDWLKKRQVEEIPVATPIPSDSTGYVGGDMESSAPPPNPIIPAAQTQSQLPTVPLQMMNPYYPFMYPLAGLKVSKAMAQAQVNAALAALNITTTQKPVKIKLKIPIPAGDDLATVVASGIAGFPPGTTYELSKK